MPPELEQWVAHLGAEMRDRVNIALFDADTQRINGLLKTITESEHTHIVKVDDRPQ